MKRKRKKEKYHATKSLMCLDFLNARCLCVYYCRYVAIVVVLRRLALLALSSSVAASVMALT